MKLTRSGLIRNDIASRESLFHVANGYLGARACFEEGTPPDVHSIRGTYINAFYETYPVTYAERLYGFPTEAQTIVNVPDQLGVALVLDGETFDPFAGTLLEFSQTLHMDAGAYVRRAVWRSPRGRETEIVFQRMASLAARELLLLEITVTPLNWSGSLEAVSTQNSDVYNDGDPNDPRKAAERKRMLQTLDSGSADGVMYLRCETPQSRQGMACAAYHTFTGAMDVSIRTAPLQNTATLRGRAAQGEPFTLTKFCVYADTRIHPDPLAAVIRLAKQFAQTPPDLWHQRQRDLLGAFWKGARVTLEGAPALQAGADFAAYTLFQSAGTNGIASIPSKGLSGEGYEGHFFWDTEIYMFPFYLLTQPQIARRLLDFRYETLDGARRQARLFGHEKGALYPWRTITGGECSTYYPSGSAQYHINSDIAHAVCDYYFVTGDLTYIRDKGMEILIETARLWLDAGHWQDGAFCIDDVTGPDEYTCLVNNNYFTNLSVKHHLNHTVLLCRKLREAYPERSLLERYGLTEDEEREFSAVAEHICLPYDEALGIYAQDDSFLRKRALDLQAMDKSRFPLLMHFHPLYLYRRQVCKQADAVLAHFLYEDRLSDAVIRRTYEYYERVTTHDSSLSPCVFSMMAARIGDPEKAYRYYLHSLHLDLDNTQRNTDDGIHAANMGGIYMGIVFGFAGLRIRRGGLLLRPCLPEAMDGYAFPLTFNGNGIFVRVTKDTVTLRAESSRPVQITVYDTQYTLGLDPLSVPLRR